MIFLVEDHFRMALGDRTFQLLKKAQQKNSNNKLDEKKHFSDYAATTLGFKDQNYINKKHKLNNNQDDNIDDDNVIVDDVDDNKKLINFQKQTHTKINGTTNQSNIIISSSTNAQLY